jgi:aspartyl-tRNA(Asn)/glutamyl-tRNA(Gln) amidotransferase subunit C
MTKISREEVLHLAQLSSLKLKEEEINGLQIDISNILGYVEQLGKLNTEGVEPTYQVTGLKNIWREDKIIDYNISREDLLKISIEIKKNGTIRLLSRSKYLLFC